MKKESSSENTSEQSEPENKKPKKATGADSFREISALGIKVMALMAVLIFFIQMMSGIVWQTALMRSVTAYVILLIIYYLSILFITIIKRSSKDKKEGSSGVG